MLKALETLGTFVRWQVTFFLVKSTASIFEEILIDKHVKQL